MSSKTGPGGQPTAPLEDPFLVRFDDFEGPLDLLLHLVRRHRRPIEQVPLAQITADYLETLDFMASIDLEPAAEFLEIAATLLRFKARVMLPTPAAPADPREAAAEEAALLQQLVEHQVVRMAATRLRQREEQAAAVWFRGDASPGGVEAEENEVLEADLFALVTAFKSVLASVAEPTSLEVTREEYPVAACIDEIRSRLAIGRPIPFLEMFVPGSPRGKLISTFLALLELVRSGAARAFQDGTLGSIQIFPTGTIDRPAGLGAEGDA